VPDLVESYDREAKGIPIGRAAEVNLRNNHSQYIFTWYVVSFSELGNMLLTLCRFGLSFATSVMMWMLIRKKPNEAMRRVRQNRNW
jgi:surfeit locus 1 family protein